MAAMRARSIATEAPELRLDPQAIFEPGGLPAFLQQEGPLEIEIGIGKGRFLLAVAEARPDVRHLGIEWANKYLRVAEARAVKRGLANVRFARVDARELVHRVLPTASVSAYYVFYPDPWPKKRHHKRRFLRRDTADQLARTLADRGTLHVSTDHADYWRAIVEVLDDHAGFERLPAFGGEGFPLPVEEPLTNYEVKYRVEGRERFRASWRRTSAVVPVERERGTGRERAAWRGAGP
jgi:tRNA (guanine-N7-)-methyltransferase